MLIPGYINHAWPWALALVVFLLAEIPFKFRSFRRRGKFVVVPAGPYGGGSTWSSKRSTLYVVSAVHVALAILVLVLELVHLHDRHWG